MPARASDKKKKTKGKPQRRKDKSKSFGRPHGVATLFSRVPVVPSVVLSRKNHDGSVAIMHYDREEYFFRLDKLSAEVWSLVDGRRSISDIKTILTTRYDLPEKRFSSDVSKLFSRLKREGLITFRDNG